MPPLKPAIGVFRVVFNGLLSGQPTANVMHLVNTTSPSVPLTQAQGDAIAQSCRSAWLSNFILRQSATDFTLGMVTVQDLGGNLGVTGVSSGTTPGGRGGASLPGNVAMCISWRTDLHFRGGHCRTYIAGLVQADQANATSWATTSLTAMLSAAANFRTAMNTTTAGLATTLVMLSRERNHVQLTPPQVFPVTSALIDPRIDSMRRRLGKDR